jgi:ribosomal protein S12 methylthiotransferase accessory factor
MAETLPTRIGVTRIARLTGLDRTGIEVASAVRPAGHILQVSNGKGRDWASAVRGALHEAAELWAAEQTLGGLVLAHRDELDASIGSEWLGGEDDSLRALWARAQRLDAAGQLWVPASAVSCPPVGLGPVAARWTSNAMGAHAQRGQALLHALYEAWEREALAQVLPEGWHPRDFSRRKLPWSCDAFTAAGFEVAVFDLTPPKAVAPVAAALLRDLELGPIPLTAGYASRPSLEEAVEAAVLEAAQSRQTEIHAAREDVVVGRTAAPSEVEALWTEVRKAKRSPQRKVRGPKNPLLFARSLGRPVAFVDLASGQLPIHVVKVLIPGFRVSELLQ